MEKETYIRITMTESSDTIDFECNGGPKDVVFLLCEAANQVKKQLVELGLDEDVAKNGLLVSVREALNTFE